MTDRFVLDCSITVAWCFEGEESSYADWVLDQFQTASAMVPQLWLLEVGNVLVTAERKGRITESESVRFLSLLESLPIEISQWLDL
jgi:predicted nucleic acid-binding protein